MTNQSDQSDQTDSMETEVLGRVASEYPKTLDEISDLDDQKKPLTKKLSKHKGAVRKIMKRKLDAIREEDPDTVELVLQVGNTTFKLEEVTSYKACPVEEMEAFFTLDAISKYKEAVEKKRLKLSVD